jgi:hypothetical protein
VGGLVLNYNRLIKLFNLMENIRWIVNLVLYHLWRFEKTTQRFVNFFVWGLLQVTRIITIDEQRKRRANHSLYDPKDGVSTIFAQIHILFLFFLLQLGILGSTGLFTVKFFVNPIVLIVMSLIAWITEYYFSSRKNLYLKYFKKFEKMSKANKRKTAILVLFIVLFIWFFGASPFLFSLFKPLT